MFLLVENYQTDHSSWSSDRLGIFEKTQVALLSLASAFENRLVLPALPIPG